MKLDNAPTPAMKERYEQEMKKEIKKLQRIRDYFRQAIGNPEVKEKNKADEARKRVEQEMENFRELERELKRKAYSKRTLHMHRSKKSRLHALEGSDNNSGSNSDDANDDSGEHTYGEEIYEEQDDEEELKKEESVFVEDSSEQREATA